MSGDGGAASSSSRAAVRLERIGGHMTELLELHAHKGPALQIVFVPGNPGVVAYYQEYLDALYDILEGGASVTAISHIAHVSRDWEDAGRLFSLQEQIDHKLEFVQQQLNQRPDVPLILVGHSIGAYIIMEILRRFPSQVQQVIGLYPFVTLNRNSQWQGFLRRVSETSALCTATSTLAGLVGRLPDAVSRGLVKVLLGRVWDPYAVDITCQHLLQSRVVHNFMYMGRTEFATLPLEPDWGFLREFQSRISFLFGTDDHWGPLSLLVNISKEIPQLKMVVEREGHLHTFSCTKAGSHCVASHTANIIISRIACAHL
ncbi:unnamed protein product [Sphagnum balticum]